MATQYTFKKKDSGIIGKAFEMAIKQALGRKNADRVSPCGSADFRYKGINYDSKQNGSPLRYSEHARYIKGSSRVVYATHVAHTVVAETADTITIEVDLLNTDMFVFDRNEFVEFLQEIGCIKSNASRGTVNVQTVYNYKKDAYHGRKGRMIEEWGFDHDLGDDIIGDILAGLE